MITLLHGDNIVSSRNEFFQLTQKAKTQNKELVQFNHKNLSLESLLTATETHSLFGDEKVITIENLYFLKSKKELSSIHEYLSETKDLPDIIIWQGKKLTATQTKKYKQGNIKEHKTSPVIFKFTDGFALTSKKQQLNLLKQAIEMDSAEMVFFMLTRHIRNCILAISDNFSGPSWIVGKQKKAARGIGEIKLLKIHHQLAQIDLQQKTGQSVHELNSQLALLIATQ